MKPRIFALGTQMHFHSSKRDVRFLHGTWRQLHPLKLQPESVLKRSHIDSLDVIHRWKIRSKCKPEIFTYRTKVVKIRKVTAWRGTAIRSLFLFVLYDSLRAWIFFWGVGGGEILSSLFSFLQEHTKLLCSVPLLNRLSYIGRCYVTYTEMIVQNLLQYILFHTAFLFLNNSQHIFSVTYFIFLFLGAYEKLGRAIICFAMAVRLSVCPHRTTRFPLDGF